jgi:hypothetical protein
MIQLELSELKRDWIDDAEKDFFNNRSILPAQFTSEHVLSMSLISPPHPNWVGCLMARLRNTGRIREVGRVRSSRPERNGAKITLWAIV